MRKVAVALALELTELESATCTGARVLRAIDPLGFLALNIRILALAERENLPLMTICNTTMLLKMGALVLCRKVLLQLGQFDSCLRDVTSM